MKALARRRPHQRRSGLAALCAAALVSSAVGAQAAEGGGLVLLPDITMLVGLIVVFIAVIFPLNALLFRPIVKALEEREERIEGTRAKAARLSEETESVLERYESAIRSAREDAERERRGRIEEARARMLDTTATARRSAEADLERARGELAGTLDEARWALRGHADGLAREAAARVLGRAL